MLLVISPLASADKEIIVFLHPVHYHNDNYTFSRYLDLHCPIASNILHQIKVIHMYNIHFIHSSHSTLSWNLFFQMHSEQLRLSAMICIITFSKSKWSKELSVEWDLEYEYTYSITFDWWRDIWSNGAMVSLNISAEVNSHCEVAGCKKYFDFFVAADAKGDIQQHWNMSLIGKFLWSLPRNYAYLLRIVSIL